MTLPAAPGTEAAAEDAAGEVTGFVKDDPETGLKSLQLMVEGVHCGGCVQKIERALQAEPDVVIGRMNLTTRRLTIAWTGPISRGNALVRKVEEMGYPAVPYDPEALAVADDRQERELLQAMAVAGFAASNVMLLAVSVWAGHFRAWARRPAPSCTGSRR